MLSREKVFPLLNKNVIKYIASAAKKDQKVAILLFTILREDLDLAYTKLWNGKIE